MTVAPPPDGEYIPEQELLDSAPSDAGGRQTVLIIDDAKENIVVLSKMLKSRVDIVFALSGSDGLKKAHSAQPDLILLDIAMPDMTGFDVLRELKKNTKTCDIPVIIVTALPDNNNEERGLRLGAVDYIIKPFSPPVVKMRISIHLRLQALNRKLLQANEELRRLATIDPLTGLYNRRHFVQELKKGLQRLQRGEEKLSLIVLDIDDFKAINDRYGHDVGDRVLVHIAKRIQSVLRSSDVFGRLGGEEFAILLPQTTVTDASRIAAELCQLLSSQPLESGEERFTVSASFGVADFLEDEMCVEQTMKKADLALYHAKRTGRDRVVVYDEKVIGVQGG